MSQYVPLGDAPASPGMKRYRRTPEDITEEMIEQASEQVRADRVQLCNDARELHALVAQLRSGLRASEQVREERDQLCNDVRELLLLVAQLRSRLKASEQTRAEREKLYDDAKTLYALVAEEARADHDSDHPPWVVASEALQARAGDDDDDDDDDDAGSAGGDDDEDDDDEDAGEVAEPNEAQVTQVRAEVEQGIDAVFYTSLPWMVCWSGELIRHLQWYMAKDANESIRFQEGCQRQWAMVEALLPRVDRARQLEIVAISEGWTPTSEGWTPTEHRQALADLRMLNIDGRSLAYDVQEVTGFDCIVQAHFASQRDTAYAVMTMISDIECMDLTRCYIQCRDVAHCSVAVACLVTMVYTQARIGVCSEYMAELRQRRVV